MNQEHIIPLCLGGIGEFGIPVCAAANAEVGSRLDGAMSRDFLTMTKRDRYDVRGHSSTAPMFVAKHCTDPAGKPLQVGFGQREGLQVWSPRDKAYIRDERAKTLHINFSVDVDIALQFVAKVALSSGYFAYGDVFRRQVKHQEFRTIMNHRPTEADNTQSMEVLVDDRFSSDKSEHLQVFCAMCEAAAPHSLVALVPGPHRFAAFVRILGDYVGMISVPSTTIGFPSEGAFRWGHVMVPRKDGLMRLSFQDALRKLGGILLSANA